MWCPRVSECWRGVTPRSPGCDQAGAHRVFLTSGTQLLPDLWRERWDTMVTATQQLVKHNTAYFQVLFLVLLLSSCHGQEYPAKVALFISWHKNDIKILEWWCYQRLIQSVRPLSSTGPSVVCQNLSSDYSIAILVDAWIMYQAISILEDCVFWSMDSGEKYGGNIF